MSSLFVNWRRTALWLVAAGASLALTTRAGAVVYVDASATSPGNGTSWGAAYTTIGAAIADPLSATEPIWIAAGDYAERLIIPSGRTLLGGFDGFETDPSQRNPDPSRTRIVSNDVRATGTMVLIENAAGVLLDGLEITGGRANGSGDDRAGGGIRVNGNTAAATLRNCLVGGNHATDGAGVAALNGASVTIQNCQILDNISQDDGGGVYATNYSTVNVQSSFIETNQCVDGGGGLYASVNSTVTLDGSTISGNTAGSAPTGRGGGVFLRQDVTGTIRNCQIYNNTSGVRGGGIGVDGSSLSLQDSRLFHNVINYQGSDPETYSGGGLYAIQSTLDVANCLIHENVSVPNGGGGAVALFDCPQANFEEDRLILNEAQIGAALLCKNSKPTLNRVACLGDNATDTGGVAWERDGGEVQFVNGLLVGNVGTAAFDVAGASKLTLNSCTATDNQSVAILDDTSTAEMRNTIFFNNQGTAIQEKTTDSDATLLYCLFDRNTPSDILDEGFSNFTGAVAINTYVSGSSHAVDGDPYLRTFDNTNTQYGFAAVDFSSTPGVLTLTGITPPLPDGSLAGRFVQIATNPTRMFEVVSNTTDAMEVYGGGWNGTREFKFLDSTLEVDSPAVDAGTSDQTPAVDYLGRPRPVDLPGFHDAGGLTFDIGAFETPADQIISAVLVRTSPSNVQNGLTWEHAYNSVQAAIDDPRSATLPIFVQEGSYQEALSMSSGRRIYGGVTLGDHEPPYWSHPNPSALSTLDLSSIPGPTHGVTLTSVKNTVLSHLQFTHGNASGAAGTADGRGGGLYASDADNSNRIEYCDFSSNTAADAGGGMALDASSPDVVACTVRSNTAANGGGIALGQEGQPVLTNPIVEANTSTAKGGGVFVDSTTFPTINGGRIDGNSAQLGGNVSVVNSSILYMDNCPVYQGNASLRGGGLYAYLATVVITNGDFGDNTALFGGGGLYIDTGGVANISQSQINANKTTASGDGVPGGGMALNFGAAAAVSNTLFRENQIGDGRGAGLYVTPNATVTLTNNVFIGNATGAKGLGGGLYIENSSSPIRYCVFLHNKAWIGGGAYVKGAGFLIEKCTFIRNQAVGGDGGGIYLNASVGQYLQDCLLYLNSADDDGGGIYMVQGSPSIYNCALVNNQCVDTGGGLLIDKAFPTLVNNVFAANFPTGIYEADSASDPFKLDYNFFDTPGIFYVDEGNTSLSSVDDINNLPEAGNNLAGPYRVAENVYALTGTFQGRTTATGNGDEIEVRLRFVDTPPVAPGQLAGQFFSLVSAPNDLYRIYDNTADTIILRETGPATVLGEAFRIRDFVPLPTAGTVDTGTDSSRSTSDLRGIPRPYPVYPGRGTGFDIGAYEVDQGDLVGWIEDAVLGKVTTFEPAMADLLDANGDGQIDVADSIALIARTPGK